MAYKFTIKGIRKFNEEKVVEKALVSYRGIDNDPEGLLRRGVLLRLEHLGSSESPYWRQVLYDPHR